MKPSLAVTWTLLTAAAVGAAGAVHAVDFSAENLPIDGVQAGTGAPGTGFVTVCVDTAANTVTYHIEITGLLSAETAAHFHGPAASGGNAGVLEPLPLGSPKDGVWNYLESDESAIIGDSVYVNIHTATNPPGEIRGHVFVDPRHDCPLDRNPVPAVSPGRLLLLTMLLLAAGVFFVARRTRASA